MKKIIHGTLGYLFLALGFIGIFVPVLPTVPFMLLASFFFFRSSERMHRWLINHSTFGPPIKSFSEERALMKSTKIKAITLLWLSLSLSVYIVPIIYVDILLIIIGISVTIYLLSLKTVHTA